MKHQLGLWLAVGGLLVAVACGGKSGGGSHDDEETGGTSTTGGFATGGSSADTGGRASGGTETGGDAAAGDSSTGGADLGGSDTGGSDTGGSDTGGRTATGGAATGGDSNGGSPANPAAECPDTAPTEGTDCTAPGGRQPLQCSYDSGDCTCSAFGPDAETWVCGGGAAGGAGPGPAAECPDAAPTDGTDCTAPGGRQPLQCSYDSGDCTCSAFGPNAETWVCDGGAAGGAGPGPVVECPDTVPDDGSDCTAPGGRQPLQCSYESADCTCSAFGPNADTWACDSGAGGAGNPGGPGGAGSL